MVFRKSIWLFAIGIMLILLPLIISNPYHQHILIMAGINGILALGFVMLLATGLVTLGAATFWAIGAYSSTLLMTRAGMSFWISLPLAGIICGVIAVPIGILTVRLSKVAFVLVTIIVNAIVVLIFGRIEFFGGWGGLVAIPGPNPVLLPLNMKVEFNSKAPYYYLMIFLLSVTILVFYALYKSRIGRAWKAIQLNPQLAQTIGIDPYRFALLAFIIVATFAGLAGSFYAHYVHTIEPETFSFWKSIYVQVYGIVGGVDYYILGPLIGSLVMTFLPEFFRITKEMEPIFTGAILLTLVIFLPGGLLSLFQRFVGFTDRMGQGRIFLALLKKRNVKKGEITHGNSPN